MGCLHAAGQSSSTAGCCGRCSCLPLLDSCGPRQQRSQLCAEQHLRKRLGTASSEHPWLPNSSLQSLLGPGVLHSCFVLCRRHSQCPAHRRAATHRLRWQPALRPGRRCGGHDLCGAPALAQPAPACAATGRAPAAAPQSQHEELPWGRGRPSRVWPRAGHSGARSGLGSRAGSGGPADSGQCRAPGVAGPFVPCGTSGGAAATLWA